MTSGVPRCAPGMARPEGSPLQCEPNAGRWLLK
jgi:hypothetical protein